MKKIAKSNPMIQTFKMVFGGVLGYMSAYTLVALFSLVFVGIGFAIISKFNKKDTKLFEDLQPMQYVGIVICCIGLLPWGQYLFFGFMEGAGLTLFDKMFN